MVERIGPDAGAVRTDFTHLMDHNGRERPAQPRPVAADSPSKAPEAVRLRKHALAATVPSRTPAQRRQLMATMELLRSVEDSAECHIEVLTLGDEVLWDYERYEIALQLGLAIRTIPVKGSDPTVRLCLEALHTPQISAGARALIAVVACNWAPSGRPKKVTLGVSFRDKPWTIEEMATLARVGTTRISEAKQMCEAQLENLVLAREISFGEAVKRVRLVRGAGLSEAVKDGTLTFDQAYEQALDAAEPAGADDDRNTDAAPDEVAPNRGDATPAEPATWEEEKAALRKRIRVLTAENARIKEDQQVTAKELEEERALRQAAEEALRDMCLRMQEAGVFM